MVGTRARALAGLALVGLMAASGTVAAQSEPEITADPGLPADLPSFSFRIAHNGGPTVPTTTEVEEVAKRITARTGGKITFEIFPSSQLGPVQDVVAQVAEGAPIISNGEPSLFSTYGAPDLAVLTAPFLIDGPEQWPTLIDSDLIKGLEEQVAANGNLRILDLGWYVGERHIIGKDPYPEPADLAGVKIRVPPLPSWTVTFEALGATPVTVDFTEVYTALSQGIVDAGEAPLSAIDGGRWQEVVKNVTLTGHFRQFQGFVMPESAFQELPPELQQIMLEEFRAGGQNATAAEIASAEALRGQFESEGVTFTEADIPAYRAATASFYTAFPDWSPDLLDEINAILGR